MEDIKKLIKSKRDIERITIIKNDCGIDYCITGISVKMQDAFYIKNNSLILEMTSDACGISNSFYYIMDLLNIKVTRTYKVITIISEDTKINIRF